mmetsp:Transcript_37761/g.70762  ORF Transcript_37761/g.70762 Transcript_37761/m.70762 type:complete len:208 (+) Transcript_37761:1152-1775(+)
MRPTPRRPMKVSLPTLEICNCSGFSTDATGFGSSRIASSSTPILSCKVSGFRPAWRLTADAKIVLKSVCSSEAPNSQKRSKVLSITKSGRDAGLSILLMTTRILWPIASAFFSTKRVCGLGPSWASTTRSTPSTMPRTRSTSPPKSAWPGVSTMFTLMSLYLIAAFFAKMVMPRSLSWSLPSIRRSFLPIFLWRSSSRSASTSVVLP